MTNCEDVDRLRALFGPAINDAWPNEAIDHALSCARCNALVTGSRDTLDVISVPEDLNAKVEKVVLEDLKPVSPLPTALHVTLFLLGVVAIVVAAAVYILGSAGWHALSRVEATTLFGVLGVGILTLANALASRMSPSSPVRIHPVFLIGTPLLGVAIAVPILFPLHPGAHFIRHGLVCWEVGFSSACAAFGLLWVVLRRGFPAKYVWQTTMTGALAGLSGLVVLQTFCPNLERAHIFVWHLGAGLSAVGVGILAGAVWGRLIPKPNRIK